MAIEAAKLFVSVGAETGEAERELAGFQNQLGSAVRSLGVTGGMLTAGVTAPLLGAGAAVGKLGIDFESAFTGVIKTVDGTEAEIAELRTGIRDMASELPASTTEISAVAEAAGQLGIQTDNILEFTRTMVDLGETTNLSASEAATQLARLANITGMSQKDFGNLGSSIVELGNNLATTEGEITTMALRIAGAGTVVGLTESEIVGMAGALSSLGINAEAGGSAISRVMIDMSTAVDKGGNKLDTFAKVAGMSADEFAIAFETDAAGAITSFITGLGEMEESGGSSAAVLDELGLGGVRVRDTLLRASSAQGLFTSALNMSASAWEENTALTDEAALRYGTMASEISVMANQARELALTLFVALQPAISMVIESVGNFLTRATALAESIGATNPEFLQMAVAIAGVAAAAGPVMLALAGIGAVIGFLISPIGLVVAATAGLAAAWATDFLGIQTKTTEAWTAIQPQLQAMSDWFATEGPDALDTLSTKWEEVWPQLETFFAPVASNLKTAWDDMTSGFSELGPELTAMIETAEPIFRRLWQAGTFAAGLLMAAMAFMGNGIAAVMGRLPEIVSLSIEQVTATLNLLSTTMTGMVDLVSALIDGDWSGAWTAAQDIFGGFVEYFLTTAERMLSAAALAFGALRETITNTMSALDIPMPEWMGRLFGETIEVAAHPTSPTVSVTTESGIIGELLEWEWPQPDWFSDFLDWGWPKPLWFTDFLDWGWPEMPGWMNGMWDTIGPPGWLSRFFDRADEVGARSGAVPENDPNLRDDGTIDNDVRFDDDGNIIVGPQAESSSLGLVGEGVGGPTIQFNAPIHIHNDMDVEQLALDIMQKIRRRQG